MAGKFNQAAYQKAWRAERLALGLCPNCGTDNPLVEGRKNCEPCLERARQASQRRRRRLREEVIQAYGGVCACCGEDSLPFLTIDHILNNGRQHRKAFTGYSYPTSGAPFYAALKKAGWPKDQGLQVLCWNCNVARYQYGTCPHQS